MTTNVTIRVPCIKKDAEQVWHGTDDDVARLERQANPDLDEIGHLLGH